MSSSNDELSKPCPQTNIKRGINKTCPQATTNAFKHVLKQNRHRHKASHAIDQARSRKTRLQTNTTLTKHVHSQPQTQYSLSAKKHDLRKACPKTNVTFVKLVLKQARPQQSIS